MLNLTPQEIAVEFNALIMPQAGPLIRPQWDAAKNELIIASTLTEEDIGHNLDMTFYIAFGEVEGAGGSRSLS